MFPHLTLFGLRIPTHEFFTVAGFAVAGAVLVALARKDGRNDPVLWWIVGGSLLGGALFTKLGTLWRYLPEAENPTLGDIWIYGGKTVLGGLAGAYIGAEVTKRLIGYRRRTGDMFAPAVALGLAVGRVGCFLTEQVGTPTSLPWGITLSADVAARVPNCPQCLTGAPMHPSFLYEIVFLLILTGVLFRLRPRVKTEGDTFKVFLISYGVFRFIVEFVRGNPEYLWGLSGSQVFLMATAPLAVLFVVRRLRERRPVPIQSVSSGVALE